MERTERLLKAAQSAFPELWETPDSEVPKQHRGNLAMARQRALTITTDAVTGWEAADEEVPAEVLEELEEISKESAFGDIKVALPDDAAMVQQVLTVVTYLDNEGVTAYVVRTSGDGLMTSWLGMCMLAQNYLLHLPARESEDND